LKHSPACMTDTTPYCICPPSVKRERRYGSATLKEKTAALREKTARRGRELPAPNADHDDVLTFEVRLRTNAPPHKHAQVAERFEKEVRLQFGSAIEMCEVKS
jgi:hypothetical protein